MDDEGVPPVPGPKMYPFKDGGGPLKIKWLRHIGKGIHAHTWAVLINGKLYVLKIVRITILDKSGYELVLAFCDVDNSGKFNFRKRYWVLPKWKVQVSKAEEIAYFDPFSCECRAYGRIREAGLEQYIAKCYGYIKLARNDFDPLMDDPKEWEARFGYKERHKGKPFRALVKEFVKTDPDRYPPLTGESGLENVRRANECFRDSKDARNLIRGLKRIQKSGILIRDINAGNIRNGRIIDFSQAWTVPHPVLVKEKMDNDKIVNFVDGGFSDASEVDQLIDVWNEKHADSLKIWDRCLPHPEYTDKIRYYNDRHNGEFGPKLEWGRHTCGWYIRPELYKWQDVRGKAEEGK